MRLVMIVGDAMTIVINRHGIDVGRINYQDNGSWGVDKPGRIVICTSMAAPKARNIKSMVRHCTFRTATSTRTFTKA